MFCKIPENIVSVLVPHFMVKTCCAELSRWNGVSSNILAFPFQDAAANVFMDMKTTLNLFECRIGFLPLNMASMYTCNGVGLRFNFKLLHFNSCHACNHGERRCFNLL